MKVLILTVGSFIVCFIAVFLNSFTGGRFDFILPVILASFVYIRGYTLFIWLAVLSLWLFPYLGKEFVWIYVFFIVLYLMVKFINRAPYMYNIRLILSIVSTVLVYNLFILDWFAYLSYRLSGESVLEFVIFIILQSIFTYFILWLTKIIKNYFSSPQKARLR